MRISREIFNKGSYLQRQKQEFTRKGVVVREEKQYSCYLRPGGQGVEGEGDYQKGEQEFPFP